MCRTPGVSSQLYLASDEKYQKYHITGYIADHKMEMEKRMLVESNQSAAKIVQKQNDNNLQNFIRLLKKQIDITPGKYRQSEKKDILLSDNLS